MEISFGPFLTCFFAIMFLTIYLYIILYRARNVFAKNTKWLFLGILLIFIRLSVPVNSSVYIFCLFRKISSTFYESIM